MTGRVQAVFDNAGAGITGAAAGLRTAARLKVHPRSALLGHDWTAPVGPLCIAGWRGLSSARATTCAPNHDLLRHRAALYCSFFARFLQNTWRAKLPLCGVPNPLHQDGYWDQLGSNHIDPISKAPELSSGLITVTDV